LEGYSTPFFGSLFLDCFLLLSEIYQPSVMASAEKGIVELIERTENHNDLVPANGAHGMWLAAKSDPKVLAYSVLMSLGPMTFGFDIVIVGVVTAIPAFL
jgi:hypothetical protein